MKKNICLVLITVVFSSALSAQPALRFTEPVFDFGKSVQKAVLTHDFWIKSVGNQPLEISEVVPGCGCTESWLSDSVIAPGDSARLHIVFSSGRFRGYVAKQPYLLTNVSKDKHFLKIYAYLEIKPEASKPVTINPPIVDVSQFDDRPRKRARFHIENVGDKNLKISIADSSLKSFTVKLPKKVKAGESVEGVITVRDDRIGYGFEESFTIQLNDIESSRYTIPVRRMLKGKVHKPAEQ